MTQLLVWKATLDFYAQIIGIIRVNDLFVIRIMSDSFGSRGKSLLQNLCLIFRIFHGTLLIVCL